MKIEQLFWKASEGWENLDDTDPSIAPNLVLFFGETSALSEHSIYQELKTRYPNAHVIGCTSAGEILDDEVYDDSIVVTAIEFEKTVLEVTSLNVEAPEESYGAGLNIGKALQKADLRGIMIVSEGLKVNGSELVRGINEVIGDEVPITGGLAGDGPRFEETKVACNAEPQSGTIAAIGFYGDKILVGHGSMGGWDSFGPKRQVTKSKGNILYELDSKPALQLYKEYLGEEAANLPGSALLFPLMVQAEDKEQLGIVRTVLAVEENENTMTFAGDIPEGYVAQLMRANFERLIDGAGSAGSAARSIHDIPEHLTKLAVLVSCVGRKMILKQRTSDEVEAVQDVLGDNTAQIGFYSYGEISPHVETGHCELHNQTMTVTVLAEDD